MTILTIRTFLPNAASTRRLGGAVAEVLEGGDVVLLIGELGAGKTTLTKGLVGALGGTEEVTSPTFTLMHLYETAPPVAHVDCWRLEDLADLVDLDLDEVLDDGGVAVIEWGELAVPLLGRDALTVSIDLAAEDQAGLLHHPAFGGECAEPGRVVLLSATGERWSRRMRHLEMACREAGLATDTLGGQLHDEPAPSR